MYLPENYTQMIIQGAPDQYGEVDINYTKTLVGQECVLSGGIVAYDIVVQNRTVTLKYDDYTNDKFLQPM